MVGRGVWFATGAEEWQTAGAARIRRFIPHRAGDVLVPLVDGRIVCIGTEKASP